MGLIELTPIAPVAEPEYTHCHCETCDNVYELNQCDTDYDHHDGWEMPAYGITVCPECECGGCITDYITADEMELRKLIEDGYYKGDAEPLQCTNCDGTDLRDLDSFEEGQIVHIDRWCDNCDRSCGHWDYGSWSW